MKSESEEEDKKGEEETVNDATALWTLPRTEIKDEEYKEFYKHIAHDFEDPLTWSHNKVEGKLDYRSEEHTSELQSRPHLVCRLLLEKKKKLTQPTPLHNLQLTHL